MGNTTTLDYTITDPNDTLYNGDVDHPQINERFEWSIRGASEEWKALHRRHRRERQELKIRQSREIREATSRGLAA